MSMTLLDWYGLAAVAAISLCFYVARRIPRYLAACTVVILGFAAATLDLLLVAPAQWIVMCAGLCLAVFGLLIVRVMLIRSVSLHMLGRLQASLDDEFFRDIGSRLDDMRSSGMIRELADGRVTLTGRGRFASSVVSALYATFRIKA